jgi:hypothetical protein
MARAKRKAKAKAKVKPARKVAAKSAAKIRRAVKKSAPRRGRAKTSSLAKEFGALADRITSFGKAVLEQGTEKAGDLARAGLAVIEHSGEKIGDELAALRRAALSRAKQ